MSPSVATGAHSLLRDDARTVVRGIGYAVLANMIWTLGDVAAKWAIPIVGVGGAMFWRGMMGTFVVTGVAVAQPGHSGLRRIVPVRWSLVLFRSALSSFVSITWYISWRSMSLVDTYAVGFTAPLIMTALAIPMLGERIRWRRAVSTVIGFMGVLIMLRPGGDLWTPVVLLLIVGVIAMSVTRIMTRQLSVTETPECQAFWLLLSHLAAGAAMCLGAVPFAGLALTVWIALGFLGISSGLAHCVYARGYALAPISALAPYEYTMLIWGGIAGYLAFNEVPSWSTILGAAVICGAGFYNLERERQRQREEVAI